jgi:hypothetical protein
MPSTVRLAVLVTKVAVAVAVCLIALLSHAPSVQPADAHVDNTDLMATYGCWSGPAPADMAGVIPPHALIDSDTGPVLVDSAIGFAIWGGTRTGILIGLCR